MLAQVVQDPSSPRSREDRLLLFIKDRHLTIHPMLNGVREWILIVLNTCIWREDTLIPLSHHHEVHANFIWLHEIDIPDTFVEAAEEINAAFRKEIDAVGAMMEEAATGGDPDRQLQEFLGRMVAAEQSPPLYQGMTEAELAQEIHRLIHSEGTGGLH